MATATAPLATQLEELSSDEILRYSRHLILPEVALEGQQRLKASRVLLIGAGGLGSPLALYLAAAGVGTIGLVDFDVVDVTNLQRQIVHGSKDVGRPKLESARDRLKDLNPHVHVEGFETRRINLTFRYVPDEHVIPYDRLPADDASDVRGYMETLAQHSPFFAGALAKRRGIV